MPCLFIRTAVVHPVCRSFDLAVDATPTPPNGVEGEVPVHYRAY